MTMSNAFNHIFIHSVFFVLLLLSVTKNVLAVCEVSQVDICSSDPVTPHRCVDSSGVTYCCSNSNQECKSDLFLGCEGGYAVGEKKCVNGGAGPQEMVCVQMLGEMIFEPGSQCDDGCEDGVGCLSPVVPSPVPDKNLVTGELLYAIDPLNPVNSGNTTNVLDGLTQLRRFILFQSPGGIISLLLPLLFTIAGLIVFVMVVWGGFEMLMSATSSKAQEAGKQRITAAIIGFVLLFISYWLAQIIQMVFGVRILG